MTTPDNSTAAIIHAWSNAYNAHDIDALVRCYDENAQNTQYPWGRTNHGASGVRTVYNGTFRAFPDISIVAQNTIANSHSVAVQWQISGTMRGEFAGKQPTGMHFTLQGCEVFTIAEGKIIRQEGYWDKETMFGLLGLEHSH